MPDALNTTCACDSIPGPELVGIGRHGPEGAARDDGDAARGEGRRPVDEAGESLDWRRNPLGESVPLHIKSV